MRTLTLFPLVMVGAFAFASIATSASATTLNLATGSTLSAEVESTTVLHPSFGNIECGSSHVEGKTTNEGGSTETVQAKIEALTFGSCNATVAVLTKGSLEIHTQNEAANGNGTLTSSGTEVTVEASGFHCIFKTNNTDIGLLTGSANTGGSATMDIEATISRTGGRSGAFCGSTAKWTGSYKVTAPNPLNVDNVAEHEWICRKVMQMTGIYEDDRCIRANFPMEYIKVEVSSTGESMKFVGSGEFEFETSLSGNSTLVKCSSASGTGTIRNPEPLATTNGKGTATLTFEGCSVSKPSECSLTGKKFSTAELNTELEENKTLAAGMKFAPASGEVFAEFTLEKCAKAELNKTWTVKGTDFGIANSSAALLEFTNASSSLTVSGSEAKIRGSFTPRNSEESILLIAP